MNDKDRVVLSNLIKEYGSEETTEKIRFLKHSTHILENVQIVQHLKTKIEDPDKFENECVHQANFLFTHYPEIFTRLIKDELNVDILYKLLDILSNIENGVIDQHEASYKVGTYLKELYIDTKINTNAKTTQSYNMPKHDISWKKYKNILSDENISI